MPTLLSRRLSAPLSAALLTVALPGPRATGQEAPRHIVVTPYLGGYFPTEDVGAVTEAGMPAPASAWLRQRDALALGATMNYWLTGRFALELGGTWAFSRLSGGSTVSPGPFGLPATFSGSANVIMGTVKLMMDLIPQPSRVNARFGLGPAVVSRNGSAFDDTAEGRFTNLTDYGAAMSLCTRLPVMDNLSVRLRLEDFIYRSKLGYEPAGDPDRRFTFDSRYQNDLVLSAGIQMWITP